MPHPLHSEHGTKSKLPSHCTFNVKIYYNVKNKTILSLDIRMPSVIQQIPVINTRQYWQQIMQFESNIINLACHIPSEITTHLDCLQRKLFYESMVKVKINVIIIKRLYKIIST